MTAVVVQFVIVRVLLAIMVVTSICFMMVLPPFVIAMRDKFNLASDLLKVEVAVAVIFKPQNPLTLLIRAENKE